MSETETQDMAAPDVDVQGKGLNEGRGVDQPTASSAVPTDDSFTAQPEKQLNPGDPNLVGAAPPAEKKSMVDKVKDLFGGVKKDHHHSPHSSAGSGVGATPESSPYGTTSGDGFTGHSLDPTGPPVGNDFGKDEGHKKASSGAPGPWPHPTNPRGETNAHGGATLTDNQGHLNPGPQEDSVKKEGFLSKIMDKLHNLKSPKNKQ